MAYVVIGKGLPRYIGVSTDTKPTAADPQGLLTPQKGSTLFDTDTNSLYATSDQTIWVLKDRLVTPAEVRVSQVIDGGLGAYTAGDVVGADECCTTLAVPWIFEVAKSNGGFVQIVNAALINETENQAVQYDLIMFNATPTGELRDNAANTSPIKGDRAKYLDTIEFRSSIARGATVATHTSASPSTVGGLPIGLKCASSGKKIYCVLVTRTAYTQTATDDIEIVLWVVQY